MRIDKESGITGIIKEVEARVHTKRELKLRLIKMFLYLWKKQGQVSRMDPVRK